MPKVLDREAHAAEWNYLYNRGAFPWRSGGITETTRRLLATYAQGPRLLEAGCGLGDDSAQLAEMGFDYLGVDIAATAVGSAAATHSGRGLRFLAADFFTFRSPPGFDVLYDKGFFHGLRGVRRRNVFLRRAAALLRPKGLWITVCGSADRMLDDFMHGAIFLRDLVSPAEVYFELLEIVKVPYGLAQTIHDFEAWHMACRRR